MLPPLLLTWDALNQTVGTVIRFNLLTILIVVAIIALIIWIFMALFRR
jgi:hypothetical protein